MPADNVRRLPDAPPPTPPFDWNDPYKPGWTERTMDRVLPVMLIGMFCVIGLIFLGLGLPKLLVEAHAAWAEVFRVWGTP